MWYTWYTFALFEGKLLSIKGIVFTNIWYTFLVHILKKVVHTPFCGTHWPLLVNNWSIYVILGHWPLPVVICPLSMHVYCLHMHVYLARKEAKSLSPPVGGLRVKGQVRKGLRVSRRGTSRRVCRGLCRWGQRWVVRMISFSWLVAIIFEV